MIVPPGSTGLSVDVQVVDDAGLAVTGLVAATFPAVSYSKGANVAATSITLSDLAAITTAHPNDNTAGGIKERSGGFYRLDLPNNALSAACQLTLLGDDTDKHLIAPGIDVRLPGVDVTNWKTATAPAMSGDAYARIGAPAGASLSADVAAVKTDTAAVKAKTDNLPGDPADASDVAGAFSTVGATLATIAAYIDTEVAAIKAKTDNLPASPAATGDCITASGVRAAVGLAAANLDAQLAAISPAAIATATLDAANAIEPGLTLRQAVRLVAAAAAGKVSVTDEGGGVFTVVLRGAGVNKARISATTDADGQRTAVSTDVTDAS